MVGSIEDDASAAGVRPRLAQAAAGQRREAVASVIEDVALGLFGERPMAKVTVDQIASEARVALRTFYRYFPTKEHVFAAMPRRGAERLSAKIAARPARETPFEALRNAVVDDGFSFEAEEISRWLKAYALSDAQDRIAPMALVNTGAAMTEALARRAGMSPDDLRAKVAGDLVAIALATGTRHWSVHGGEFQAVLLEALDIAGRGVSEFGRGP